MILHHTRTFSSCLIQNTVFILQRTICVRCTRNNLFFIMGIIRKHKLDKTRHRGSKC